MATAARAGRMASLDLLRLIAAVAVAAFHYLFRGPIADGYLTVSYPEAAPLAIFGYLGVRLFFLISGFVIAWSAEGRDVVSFALARFVRLWPGFAICMAITFVVMATAAHPAFPVTWAQFVANLTMFAPAFGQPFMDGAYWSIVLEIVFYFWVALAVLAGLFDRRRLELVAAWLVVAVANEFVVGSEALRNLFVTEYAGFFAGGILAYDMMARGRRPEALALFAAAFLFSAASLFSGRAWMLEHYGEALSPLALVVSAFAVYAIFLGALAVDIRPSRATALLGALTYPLYLLHQHVGYALIEAFAPHIGRWPAVGATFVIAFAAAGFVVVALERPAQAWLKPRLALLTASVRGSVAATFSRGTG